jgi:hypothetical protein
LRIGEQELQLRTVDRGLRHQFYQPRETLRQRVRPARLSLDVSAGRGGAARDVFSGTDPGGEAGKPLVYFSDAVQDQQAQRPGEPAPRAVPVYGQAQPMQDGGKTFGRGAGWIGHAELLVKVTDVGKWY